MAFYDTGGRPTGRLGREFVPGAGGSSPGAQRQFEGAFPGLHPERWSASGAGYGSQAGIPGSGGFQILGDGSQQGGTISPGFYGPGMPLGPSGGGGAVAGMGMLSGMAGGGLGMGAPGGGGFAGGGAGQPPWRQGGGEPEESVAIGGGFEMPSFEMPGMPGMKSVGGASTIVLPNGTRVDLRNPDAVTIAAGGVYGDLVRSAVQAYQSQLQYKQGMTGLNMEYGWRPWELEQNQAEALRQRQFQERMMGQNFEETARERASREGMQRYGLEEPHRQSQEIMGQMPDFLASLGGGLGGLGGGGGGGLGGLGASPTAAPTSQLNAGGAGGAGMFENALQGRFGAMEAGNAAGTEQQRQALQAQATGPGGGMASPNAAMGARLQHGNMMADVQGRQNLRQQMMAEQQLGIGRMGGAAGLLGALRG